MKQELNLSWMVEESSLLKRAIERGGVAGLRSGHTEDNVELSYTLKTFTTSDEEERVFGTLRLGRVPLELILGSEAVYGCEPLIASETGDSHGFEEGDDLPQLRKGGTPKRLGTVFCGLRLIFLDKDGEVTKQIESATASDLLPLFSTSLEAEKEALLASEIPVGQKSVRTLLKPDKGLVLRIKCGNLLKFYTRGFVPTGEDFKNKHLKTTRKFSECEIYVTEK